MEWLGRRAMDRLRSWLGTSVPRLASSQHPAELLLPPHAACLPARSCGSLEVLEPLRRLTALRWLGLQGCPINTTAACVSLG